MTNRAYEPLTAENAALLLVDHQVGLVTGVRDLSIGELKHNVVALAKVAKALKRPMKAIANRKGWSGKHMDDACSVLADATIN